MTSMKICGRISALDIIDEQLRRPFSVNSLSLANQYQKRSATAFDLKHHYSHKSVYSTSSTNYAIKSKYLTFRSRSTVNNRFESRAKSRANKEDLVEEEEEEEEEEEDEKKPKRSFFTLLRIGLVYFGIELLFSLETALTVPILLKLKVPES